LRLRLQPAIDVLGGQNPEFPGPQIGDDVLLDQSRVVGYRPLGQVAQVEERLRSVSRYGRLASWAEDTDDPARSARSFGVPRRVA
jgi:hypothetical protein